MLIYCPKCSTGYEIDDELIKNKSRKLKCSSCGEIFDVGAQKQESADVYSEIPMDDISEENAFEALAAMMRDADIIEDEPVVDNNENIEIEALEEGQNLNNDVAEISQENISAGDVDKNFAEVNVDETNLTESENEDKIVDSVSDEVEISIESIYERLSEHTSHLIEREKQLPLYEKIWFKIKDVLGFHFKIKWSYIFVGIFVFVSLSLFNNRYDVVRALPFMNGMYKFFGINAKITGEGLEFQNVTWDYVAEENVRKMEIKGFINNVTTSSVEVPIVHVEILDNKTSLLQSFNREIKETEISPADRVPLQIIIENPAPTAKYIYLTFIDKQ